MHSIRSKARHAAWKTEQGARNFNPFARVTPRDRERLISDSDLEANNVVPDNHSESCVTPEMEHRRQLGSKEDNRDFEGPQHASTLPTNPGSATSTHFPPHKFAPIEQFPKETKVSDEPVESPTADVDAGQRPRRRFRKFLKLKRKREENEKRTRTNTQSSKPRRKLTFASQFRTVVLGSWINVLFVFVPIGFAVNYAHVKPDYINFVVNFIAIIPLAGTLSYATEEIALHVGETIGGLLNATFGNAVELIVSILALVKHEYNIVKTSLIGSMLSNLLLVMGMAFFLGGVNRFEQFFNVTVAQTAASMLALCIGSLLIPTAFHEWSEAGETGVAPLSRGTSVILLLVYGCYLFFQLKSHVHMFNEPSQKVEKRKRNKIEDGSTQRGIASIGAGNAATAGGRVNAENLMQSPVGVEKDEEKEEPNLTVIGALITLLVSTVLVALCADFMVDGIHSVTGEGGGISETFVGLILIPIVGNAAEHATAVTVAIKDKMDLAIGVAVGSSMQIALLVLPFTVILGWIMGTECMSLYFDGFQIAVLFVAVLLVNYLIQDGKSHWLEGVLLIATYIIIAIAAYFYPRRSEECR
ncbi:calcium/proton exchanger [Patellaria atrata CBS 101060]|uniref:Vacuolar calcium ion transporter n=1 Tax=Patellaria atrata CBS 101060 TaxID=1346257 RepID=A0A9P4S9Y7_9PEZI|nr:calcium/proton exchanger [Patellaria atrata CBS 101060]